MFIDVLIDKIPLYGLFFYLGIIFAAIFAFGICKRRDLPAYEVAYSAVYIMIGAIIGSKLLFVLVSYKQIAAYDLSLEAIIKGRFVFYGGLLGGVIGLIIYTKQYKLEFLRFADVFATVVPLGHAFGRIGCYFAGCCYGLPYNGPLSCIYTETVGLTPLNIPLFPIQLLEAICLLTIFGLLLFIYFKYKKCGLVTSVYLLAYSLLRFIIEFFRGDVERGVVMYLSTSQYISMLLFAAGVLLLLRIRNIKWADMNER